jgi:hypothetical protein
MWSHIRYHLHMHIVSLALSIVLILTACTTPDFVEQEAVSSSAFGILSSSASSLAGEEVRSFTETDECDAFDIEYAEPTTTVLYSDSLVSFSMPFNPAWNTEPFERADTSILFGVFHLGYSPFDGCGYRRAFSYWTTNKRTAEDAEKYYEKEFPVDPKDVVIRRIGSVDLVSVTNIQAVCPAPTLEVIGKNENHLFSTSCEAVSQLDRPLEELEKIVQSLKLQ